MWLFFNNPHLVLRNKMGSSKVSYKRTLVILDMKDLCNTIYKRTLAILGMKGTYGVTG